MSKKSPKKLILVLLLLLPLIVTLFTREPPVLEGQVKFAVDPVFLLRYNGLSALEEMYNIQFPSIYEMAIGLTHEALRQEDVDIGMGYTTDGKIKELDLIALEDDLDFFPANNPALVVRRDVLEMYPEIREVMNDIISKLHADTMIQLNYLVDIEELDLFDVASNFLLEHQIPLEKKVIDTETTPLIIGSMQFTEHQILNSLTIKALEAKGVPVQEKTYLIQTEENQRTDLLEGHIDMYWEYLETGMNLLFEEEREEKDIQEVFHQLAIKDAENDIIWLDYAPFSSSYTIIMRREHAEDLGITSLSELAEWMRETKKEP